MVRENPFAQGVGVCLYLSTPVEVRGQLKSILRPFRSQELNSVIRRGGKRLYPRRAILSAHTLSFNLPVCHDAHALTHTVKNNLQQDLADGKGAYHPPGGEGNMKY